MRWSIISPKPLPPEYRWTTKFAWLPTRVKNTMVWLEHYRQKQFWGTMSKAYLDIDWPGSGPYRNLIG